MPEKSIAVVTRISRDSSPLTADEIGLLILIRINIALSNTRFAVSESRLRFRGRRIIVPAMGDSTSPHNERHTTAFLFLSAIIHTRRYINRNRDWE